MQEHPTPPHFTALQRLPEFSVLAIEGSDSLAFAQSQFSNDATALQPGEWQWSAWLSAKGRVLAVFALLRRPGDEGLWLVLPDHPADLLAPALSRFVLRRKCCVRARPDLQVCGLFVDGMGNAPVDALACLRMQGDVARVLCVLPADTGTGEAELAAATEWRLADIRQGLPRLPAEGGSHTAHMLGLDRLQALSLSKGCYPGQEIVARTHYLGQSKRRLGRLRAPAGWVPEFGTSVHAATQPCGEVINACADAHGVEIQAVLSDTAADAALSIGEVTAEWFPLSSPPLPDLTA